MRTKSLVFVALLAAALPVAAVRQQAPAGFALSPCEIAGVSGKANCGTFEVWENRAAKAGRRIGLRVVVLPATGARRSDAFTYLAGGPGEAATRIAPFLTAEFPGVREHQDMLLVDQRGTGGSHPLDCDLYPGTDPQAALGPFFPLERVKQCRAQLEKTSDLRMYTTSIAMDDLDDVRQALGYERLNLFGGSYGTRAALVFLRRHPDRVRSAVLQGVQPPTDLIPLHFASFAQQAIERVFADCAAEKACAAAFPDLPGDLKKIVAATSSAPVSVEILDPRVGSRIKVSLSRDLLGEALRYLLYQSATALLVPSVVHQAAGGDFTPLAEFALFSRRQLVNGLGGQGMYLSVTCSEDLPFIDAAEAERAAAGTFLGDYRYRQQRAACDAWVSGPVPADAHEPVRGDAPVLMLSGAWDPVTPPSNAKEAAATLSHASHMMIPSGGHDYEGLEGTDCVGEAIERVLDRANVDSVDPSCVKAVRRPPFPTSPMPTRRAELTAAQMMALAGRYTAEGAPNLEIHVTNGQLIASLEGQDALALVPVSPTRLRVLGAVGTYLEMEMENGRAVRATLVRTGVKSLTWKRAGG